MELMGGVRISSQGEEETHHTLKLQWKPTQSQEEILCSNVQVRTNEVTKGADASVHAFIIQDGYIIHRINLHTGCT